MSAIANMHRCTVRRNANILTVTRVGECRIDLLAFFADPQATDEENGLIDRLTDGLPESIAEAVDLSTEELRMLAGIRNRQNPAPAAPPVVQVSNPPAPPAPSVVPSAVPASVADSKLDKVESRNTGAEAFSPERTVNAMARAVKFWEQRMWHLNYYIPAAQSDSAREDEHVPNPCKWLRSLGWMHEDGSNGFMPDSVYRLPQVQRWLDDVNTRGRRYQQRTGAEGSFASPVPYDPEFVAVLRERADRRLRTYITGLHTSLITRIATAEDTFQKERERIEESLRPMVDGVMQAASLASDPLAARRAIERAEEARDRAVRAVLREKITDLETAVKLAEMYDDEMKTADLLDALRAALRANGEEHNRGCYSKGKRPLRLPR